MRAIEDKSVLVKLLDTLDETQKRWFVGREAMLLGHGGIKRMLNLAATNSLETQMEVETRTIVDMAITEDGREGVRAFIAKRKAQFVGQ